MLVVVLVDTDPRYQRDDWRGVAHALGPATPQRVVLVDPGSGLIPLQSYMHGLRTLSRPVAVRELDLVVVPPNVQGAGIGTTPQLIPGQGLPPGFTLAGVTRTCESAEISRSIAPPLSRPTSLRRAGSKGHRHGRRCTAPVDRELHLVAGLVGPHRRHELIR